MLREHKLLMDAVLFNKNDSEIAELKNNLDEKIDWIELAGQMVNHRLGGYFYLSSPEESLSKVPKELRETWKLLVQAQKLQMSENINAIKTIIDKLEYEKVKYAALKGLVFNADFYPIGCRRSNDLDLFVHEESLNSIDKIFRDQGFIQSFLPNDQMIEATKKEKLIQRMNYHDLVPYVKQIDNKILCIDINFLFDSKENLIDDEIFKYGTAIYQNDTYLIRGLPFYTNLAHLCIHFHRESTNTLWTNGYRDIILYKVVDIMNLIRAHKNELNPDEWITFMNRLNLQKKCYYTFYILKQFYDDSIVNYIEEKMRPEDTSFVDEIFVEGENRIIKRTEKFIDSAFNHIR